MKALSENAFSSSCEGGSSSSPPRRGPEILDGRANAVYVDDIQLALTTAAVAGPSSYALLLAGLATVGAIARRRHA